MAELEILRRISVSNFCDERGDLLVSELGLNPIFEVKRIYSISNVGPERVRGQHAHKKLQQIFFALKGSFCLSVTNGTSRESVTVSHSDGGYYLPSGYWRELSAFSTDAVCLVLASSPYSAEDYIFDYREYLSWREAQ